MSLIAKRRETEISYCLGLKSCGLNVTFFRTPIFEQVIERIYVKVYKCDSEMIKSGKGGSKDVQM